MSTTTTRSAPPRAGHRPPGLERHRRAAILTGLVGALIALLSGLLPVQQDRAEIMWSPSAAAGSEVAGSGYESLTTPLVSGRPVEMDISLPCGPLADVSEGTTIVSTLPADAPGRVSDGLLVQRARTAAGQPSVEVIVRNTTLLSVPVERLESADCEHIRITADTGLLSAQAVGLVVENGPDGGNGGNGGDGNDGNGGNGDGGGEAAPEPVRGDLPGSMRPELVGIFTDLTSDAAPDGLEEMRVHITVDSRYSSSPTVIKTLLMILGVLATLASLWFLHRLDQIDGRRDRRFVPRTWRRLSPVDGVVIGVLGLWHIIGANTSDDGYLLTMARSAGPSGYMANYYRWLGSPESPVGWYYEILKLLTEFSTASPWVRLPTLVCGILAWLIISREVIPRFGVLARHWTRPQWTGAAVFLAFWMAFNNGLRPEPVIALGALLTWSLIERSIATRRLLPAVVAVGVAAFSVGTGPTGLMCVAALLAGLRPIYRSMRDRAAVVGWLPLLAPLLAVGLSMLFTVFADQTLAAVAEATRIRTDLGPSLPWYGEKERWIALFGTDADGGLSRRLPVLLMLACLALTSAVFLRRGKIPGVARGPALRLIGVIAGSLLFLVFTPTKWTHHFGVFAGLGGALAVLTVLALRREAVSRPSSRWLIGAVLLLVVAMSTATNNAWWYVSSYGMPFSNDFPQIGGIYVNQAAFAGFLLCIAVAGLIHVGILPDRPVSSAARALRTRLAPLLPARLRPRVETPARRAADHSDRAAGPARRDSGGIVAPLTLIAFAVVAFQLASTLNAVVAQSPGYTIGRSNTRALLGQPCGLADSVLVEQDSNDGILEPVGADIDIALGAGGADGFAPNGVPENLDRSATQPAEDTSGTATAGGVDVARDGRTDPSVTGGRGPVTVNGSTVALPFDLDPDTTPVLGSYRRTAQVPASLTSSWFSLPARSANRPLIVIAVAGRIPGGGLRIEYGRPGRVGQYGPTDMEVLGSINPIDIGPSPRWRNVRVPVDAIPDSAEMVRIVAVDRNLDPDWWLAVTPPRNPRLQTLDEVVGHETPVLSDWVVSLAFPCQRPFRHNTGIAEVPEYRILPDRTSSEASNWWQSARGGGPLRWIEQLVRPVVVPTYLDHDWSRDWGSLQRYVPRDTSAQTAPVEYSSRLEWGWQGPGPMY